MGIITPYRNKVKTGIATEIKEVIGKFEGGLAKSVGVEEGQAVTTEAFEALAGDKHVITGNQLCEKHNTTRNELDDQGNVVIDKKTGKPKQISNRVELIDGTCSA